ncbi:hypothetical protein ES708_23788 [subsurface metagenome]
MPEKIKVDIKEIYKMLCPECKTKLENAMVQKISGAAVREALKGKSKDNKEVLQ